ncbi:MAG: FISUMP domain-containing protein [Desulfobacula sp.]
MKKYCNLFFLFCAVSLIPVLCHASDWDFDSDGDVDGKDLYFLTGTFSSDDLEPFVAAFGSVESLEVTCGAYVAPGVWKEFDCYNLAAIGKNTNDDPFTPSWRLNGGYWHWGRKGPDPSQWYNTNTPDFAHGPTGPGAGEANSGSINGWDHTHAPNGAWSDAAKTANDPCPAGYRVPTKTQWDGVLNNNTQSVVGTWPTTSNNHTNYSTARFFGDGLMLPAAGGRGSNAGHLGGRGSIGYYWPSSEYSFASAWYLEVHDIGARTKVGNRQSGFSVRCIAE